MKGVKKVSRIDVRNKESPYVVGYGDEIRFNEFRVRVTGFYAITEPMLDYGENSFNYPLLTVQSNYTAEQPSEERFILFRDL